MKFPISKKIRAHLHEVRHSLEIHLQNQFWNEKKYIGFPTPSFYIIRRRDPKVGLFSYFITNLGGIRKAVESGYTPVIDMMTYPNTYLSAEDVNQINAWEYFFEQPCKYTLQNTKFHCKIVNSGEVEYSLPSLNSNPQEFLIWKEYANQYIRFSSKALHEIDTAYQQLIPAGKRILGVLCRGSDYINLRPHGHPVQPTVEMMIEKVESALIDWQCEYIYLATEDYDICEKFKEKFGQKVIFQTADKLHYDHSGYVSDYMPAATSSKLQQGMTYLVSIGILTRCNAFIAGNTSGTLGVMLLPNQFEHTYIWDLGLYD